MARRSPPSVMDDAPAKLVKPRAEVEAAITRQIALGEGLLSQSASVRGGSDAMRQDHRVWHDFNRALLSRAFDTQSIAADYATPITHLGMMVIGPGSPPYDEIGEIRSDIGTHVQRLRSIHQQLSIIDEVPGVGAALRSGAQVAPSVPTDSHKVFIVHGHDEAAKANVARTLEKLGIEAVILHEHANKGRTLIEKLEAHADVGFAVVILTPDDVGAAKADAANLHPRARQNVVMELGFFIGRLQRDRVCALLAPGVEKPSDFDGVVYVPLDSGGAWRFLLAQELQAAGIDVDMNKLAVGR